MREARRDYGFGTVVFIPQQRIYQVSLLLSLNIVIDMPFGVAVVLGARIPMVNNAS